MRKRDREQGFAEGRMRRGLLYGKFVDIIFENFEDLKIIDNIFVLKDINCLSYLAFHTFQMKVKKMKLNQLPQEDVEWQLNVLQSESMLMTMT